MTYLFQHSPLIYRPMKVEDLAKSSGWFKPFAVLCGCYTMELVMYFGNDCIAARPLNPELISKPGYISTVKRQLLKENETVLRYADNEPDFLILNFAFAENTTS